MAVPLSEFGPGLNEELKRVLGGRPRGKPPLAGFGQAAEPDALAVVDVRKVRRMLEWDAPGLLPS